VGLDARDEALRKDVDLLGGTLPGPASRRTADRALPAGRVPPWRCARTRESKLQRFKRGALTDEIRELLRDRRWPDPPPIDRANWDRPTLGEITGSVVGAASVRLRSAATRSLTATLSPMATTS